MLVKTNEGLSLHLLLLVVTFTLTLTLTKVSAYTCQEDYYFDRALEFCRPCAGICEEGRWEPTCENLAECSAYHKKTPTPKPTQKTEHLPASSSNDDGTSKMADTNNKPSHYKLDTGLEPVATKDGQSNTAKNGMTGVHSQTLWVVIAILAVVAIGFSIAAFLLQFRNRRSQTNTSSRAQDHHNVSQDLHQQEAPSVEDINLPTQESLEHLQILIPDSEMPLPGEQQLTEDEVEDSAFMNVQLRPLDSNDHEHVSGEFIEENETTM